MKEEIKNIIKSDVLFQFYTWMKLATMVLYIDLFWGIYVKSTNLTSASMSDINMSLIIVFIICSASIFLIATILMPLLRSIMLFIDTLIVSKIKKLLIGDVKNNNVIFHELSYSNLIDYALKKDSNIAYNLALLVSKEYVQMKLNRYVATVGVIFFCFDINYGSILSNIFMIPTPIKYFIYLASALSIYFLLRNIHFNDTGSYKTTSEDIYNLISKNDTTLN